MPVEYGEPLSERELEVVVLVAEGLTNREIAVTLFLSPNTIKVHLRNIFIKAGVASRTELSILAVREGWIAVTDAEHASESLAVEMTVEEGVEEEDAETERPLPFWTLPVWPPVRWISLVLGGWVALLVLLLPSMISNGANGSSTATGLVDNPREGESLSVAAIDEGGWTELPPLPVRRARFGTAVLQGEVYVVGGLMAEGATDRLDIFQIMEERWVQGAPRPVALANVGAAVVAGKIVVPGGCDAQGAPVATVHAYDPDADRWTELAPLPEPLCAYALTAFEDTLYVFGGWDGDRYRALTYRYDGAQDTWSEGVPPVEARGFGAVAALGRQLYYVGGYDGHERATCEVYTPAEERWDSCTPLLAPRGGLGLAALGGRLYAVGGGWEGYLGFNESYGSQDASWTVLESPLVGEWRNLGLVAWETSLYAVGGWSGDYLNRTYTLPVLPFRIFIPVTLP